MRVHDKKVVYGNQSSHTTTGHNVEAAGDASLCRFFVNGLCNRGSQCLYSHSIHAKRPPCKFFFSLQVITNLKYLSILLVLFK